MKNGHPNELNLKISSRVCDFEINNPHEGFLALPVWRVDFHLCMIYMLGLRTNLINPTISLHGYSLNSIKTNE